SKSVKTYLIDSGYDRFDDAVDGSQRRARQIAHSRGGGRDPGFTVAAGVGKIQPSPNHQPGDNGSWGEAEYDRRQDIGRQIDIIAQRSDQTRNLVFRPI